MKVNGELHIVRGERIAVGERHAVPELQGPDRVVLIRLERLGELGLELGRIGVPAHESVVDSGGLRAAPQPVVALAGGKRGEHDVLAHGDGAAGHVLGAAAGLIRGPYVAARGRHRVVSAAATRGEGQGGGGQNREGELVHNASRSRAKR